MTRRTGRMSAWAILGIAAVALVLGAVSAIRVATHETPRLGAEWIQSSAGPVVAAVDPDGPAARAGLRPGDLLVRVDGREIHKALDAAEIAWEAEPGRSVDLVVRRGASLTTVHVDPAIEPRDESYGYLTLVGLAFLVSGVFVVLRWPTVRGGRAYSAFAIAMFVRFTFTYVGSADALDWTVYWLDVAAGFAASALLLHVTLTLARRVSTGALVGFVYVPAAAALGAALWVHPAALGGAYRFPEPRLAVEAIDRFVFLAFGVAVLASIAILARAHAATRSTLHRGQLRWVLWGLTLGFLPFLALLGFPWSFGASDLPSWARFLAVVPLLGVPAAFTTALARYRLHDLDMFLRRLVSEVAAVFLTFAVYAAVAFVLRNGLDDAFGLSRSATRYVGFLIAAVSYPQLRHWMRSAVDRAFYRKRYSYRVTLQEWARDLAAEVELVPLLRRLRERVCETLGVDRADVYVVGAGGRFVDPTCPRPHPELDLDDERKAELTRKPYVTIESERPDGARGKTYLFGMRVKDRLRAVLALSERDAPEQPLSSEDRSLLATLSAHAATAIEAARLLREVREQADEVRELHARERSILESSAVGLAMIDAEGRILAWNRALGEIYGQEPAAAIGRELADVFPLHFVRFVERRFESAGVGEETRVFRYTLVDRRGVRRVLNLTISPASGEPDGERGSTRVVTFDDVSEQVKLEEQLLQQERLASLGMLAAGVAHEVNTPLTGISSYTQMLLEQLEDRDPRRELLRKIDAQTRRASDIANSLLNLAHPERATFEAIDLNGLARDTLHLFDGHVRGRGIRLLTSFDDDLPAVRGHRGKLQQVLLNLLINACDAVGDAGGCITVSTARSDGAVTLEVSDDGAGIAEDDLPRIFDPFFTTKGRERGTGLGLSISYGIVRDHGGEILVESDPGVVTRFRVELPVLERAAATG